MGKNSLAREVILSWARAQLAEPMTDEIPDLYAAMGGYDDTNRVEPAEACPGCGETDIDKLVWDDECVAVTCQTCSTVYVP